MKNYKSTGKFTYFKNTTFKSVKNGYNRREVFLILKKINEEIMLPIEPNEALSPSERRRSDRKKLIVDVKFEDGDATGIANTRDIGIGGLYMTTNARLESGMPLAMNLFLGGREIALEGMVAYIDAGQGVGIRFQNLDAETRELLAKELDL